jgi:outer membrane biosynthesis protein TonB
MATRLFKWSPDEVRAQDEAYSIERGELATAVAGDLQAIFGPAPGTRVRESRGPAVLAWRAPAVALAVALMLLAALYAAPRLDPGRVVAASAPPLSGAAPPKLYILDPPSLRPAILPDAKTARQPETISEGHPPLTISTPGAEPGLEPAPRTVLGGDAPAVAIAPAELSERRSSPTSPSVGADPPTIIALPEVAAIERGRVPSLPEASPSPPVVQREPAERLAPERPRIRAVHVAGALSRKDFPKRAWAGGRRSTIVHFDVRDDGTVGNCSVAQSSGDADLDGVTCALVQERFRYDPAQDGEGRATSDRAGWKQEWWIEPRSGRKGAERARQ